jgi:hypothetical protein
MKCKFVIANEVKQFTNDAVNYLGSTTLNRHPRKNVDCHDLSGLALTGETDKMKAFAVIDKMFTAAQPAR